MEAFELLGEVSMQHVKMHVLAVKSTHAVLVDCANTFRNAIEICADPFLEDPDLPLPKEAEVQKLFDGLNTFDTEIIQIYELMTI